jgi:hypothetical protein
MPFVWSTSSTLGGCCGFPVADGFCPSALPYDLIPISKVIREFPSSSTSVVVTSSSYGEGIALTSTIPSSCVKNCSSFAGSFSDLWLFHVFHVVWIGASTFVGSTLGNYSLCS